MKLLDFENNKVISHGNDNILIEDNITNFDKAQININMELILDISYEIINIAFICKHFTRKWAEKYTTKVSKKKEVVT